MKMNVLCPGVLGRADGRLYRGVCSLPHLLLGDEPSTAGQTLQERPRGGTSALGPLRHELRLKFRVINETDHRLVQSWYYLANYVVSDSGSLTQRYTYSFAAKHLIIGGVGIWERSRTNFPSWQSCLGSACSSHSLNFHHHPLASSLAQIRASVFPIVIAKGNRRYEVERWNCFLSSLIIKKVYMYIYI